MKHFRPLWFVVGVLLALLVLWPRQEAHAQAAAPLTGTCHATITAEALVAKDGSDTMPFAQFTIAFRVQAADAQPFYTRTAILNGRLDAAERDTILRGLCLDALRWKRARDAAQAMLDVVPPNYAKLYTFTAEQVP